MFTHEVVRRIQSEDFACVATEHVDVGQAQRLTRCRHPVEQLDVGVAAGKVVEGGWRWLEVVEGGWRWLKVAEGACVRECRCGEGLVEVTSDNMIAGLCNT